MAITIIGRISYILFRIPFESRSSPGSFFAASERVMDSSQDLLEDKKWNPDTLSSIPQLIYKTSFPKPLPISMGLEAKTTSVDGYIYDIMGVALLLPYCII